MGSILLQGYLGRGQVLLRRGPIFLAEEQVRPRSLFVELACKLKNYIEAIHSSSQKKL
jgi:hypothetical protein